MPSGSASRRSTSDRQVDVRDPVRRLLRQEDVAGRVRHQQVVVRHQLLPAGQRLGGRVQEARERAGDRVAVHDRDADDEGARARPGGVEHRRAARQQLLEPAMVAQAHAGLEALGRLAPDRPAVAVEHRDTHAEERRAVMRGFEEHLLGRRRAVEQVRARDAARAARGRSAAAPGRGASACAYTCASRDTRSCSSWRMVATSAR